MRKSRMTKLITESIYHRTLNGTELVKQREAIGLNQDEFAKKCGWSQPFQCQLESSESHEIPTLVAKKIIAIFAEYKQSLI